MQASPKPAGFGLAFFDLHRHAQLLPLICPC